MGMIDIKMRGSFAGAPKDFNTCAETGGHVAAIKRAIAFLVSRLGDAVALDVELACEGETPPGAPFGHDGQDEG